MMTFPGTRPPSPGINEFGLKLAPIGRRRAGRGIVMGFAQVFRELWVAWRTHYAFTLAAVFVGLAFSLTAYLTARISAAEFLLLAGFFALLGPLMIVARELRAGGPSASDRAA
jgi:fucose 4-O-acetylase-like acetyltransferase